MNEKLYIVLALLTSHFLFDYVFRTKEMLEAKKTGKPVLMIFAHALWHALGAMLIIHFIKYDVLLTVFVFIVILVTHFFIDWIKAKLNVWFPVVAKSENHIHWIVFGADQLLHQIVIIFIVTIFI